LKALILEGGGGGFQDVVSALHLGWEGAEVTHSRMGRQALELCRRLRPDVIVIDSPGSDSQWLGLVREAREVSTAAIIVVSREYNEGDLIEAVEAGADDYLQAPINRSVFVAKVRAALRRVQTLGPRENSPASCGDLTVDPDRHEARISGQRLHLTATEFDLLLHLARRNGLVARKESLCSVIWGEDGQLYAANLRKYIEHLRRKLREVPGSPVSIVTLPKVGYKMIEDDGSHPS